ncbi:MAG: Fic family protein [Gammaproteobacteria bacterium]|nr:Fic family protein [Gammaproteobacteria bacterium]
MRSDIGNQPTGKYTYLHWDQVRVRPPPTGYTSREWWAAIKLRRISSRHELPFKDKSGVPFSFNDSGNLYRLLHEVDREASGRIEVARADVVNPDQRERYMMNSLIEEAIASSQLEGAVTTRRVAKEMLRSGRRPTDTSEQMIVNNYAGMEFLRANTREELSVPMLLELQRILTDGTLDDANAVGRFRNESDAVHVVDRRDGRVVHTPPPADELESRMKRLVEFANAHDEDPFIHPVVKAILLHFMIGYDHPFVDGNGRTARALFYWSMARSGYWLVEFLSISTIIRRSPAQYVRAYVYSETDDNDVTYFLVYNLRVISRAIQALHVYLTRKARESRDLEETLRGGNLAHLLNHRQVALLSHVLKYPDTTYTIESHRRSHNVTYETARTDLIGLTKLGFVNVAKRGRKLVYRRHGDVEARIRSTATHMT